MGAGLYILDEKDNKELKHFYEGWKLDSSHINQIYKDRKGGLWIATYNGLGYVEDTNHPEQIKSTMNSKDWQTAISEPFSKISKETFG